MDDAGVRVVKVNDKKLAKSAAGVTTFPSLTFFKVRFLSMQPFERLFICSAQGKDINKPLNFEGDLSDSEAILDFLASSEALDLPDQIEQVNAKQLQKLIEEKTWLAVLFRECALLKLLRIRY